MECDSNLQHSPYSSLAWDLHNLGILNADMSIIMESTTPIFSPLNSDFSTGYLQDALVEWRNRCKRRRLFPDESTQYSDDSSWDWNCSRDPSEDSNCLGQIDNSNEFAEEPLNSTLSSIKHERGMPESERPDDAILAFEMLNSSSSYHDNLLKSICTDQPQNQIMRSYSGEIIDCHGIHAEDSSVRQPKKLTNRVVYPFAVVKPGGFEGDMTLNDINERMLMPPTRPVRHPVGDFACPPCFSPHGTTGISGKAVVAFTRIQTRGRGTITIVRTTG